VPQTRPGSVCATVQSEVQYFHGAILADRDIGRLQVAMENPARMRGGEAVGHSDCDPQRLVEAQSVARDRVLEALPAHVLHDQKVDPVNRREFVNRDDVGVVQ